MLANVNINLKSTTGILSLATTAALLDVQQQYFNEQRDIVDDLRTYGYLINDSFLLTDYDAESKALTATQKNSVISGSTASVAANSIQRSSSSSGSTARSRTTHPSFGIMSPVDISNSSSGGGLAASNDSSSIGGGSIFLDGNLQNNFNFIIFNQSIGIGSGSGGGISGIGVDGFIKNDSAHNNDSSSNSSLLDDVLLTGDEVLPMPEDVAVLLKIIIMSIVLGLMILITIIGNVFVIAAIILERNLQNVANYLVVSLAVADLFVACLVMPLGAVYEISEGWILGPELCDIWTSCDVLCCTASILHLVAIATDRYWTVTNIDYHNLRTPRRIFCMIFTVWFFAVIVSLAPQFGWKDPEYMERIEQQKCMVSQDVIYQIFATCCSFYVPLLMILVLYWKIYKIARKRIQRRTQRLRYNNKPEGGKEVDFQSKPIKRKRIKICFSKDVSSDKCFGAPAAAGDNLTNNSNSNMREETEFSTSNFDSKSHAGTELTNVSDENTTSMADERTPLPLEISTVSQQVAATTSTFQQHVTAIVLTSATPRLTDCSNSNSNSKQPPTKRQLLPSLLQNTTNPHHKLAKRRQQIEAKRERKAAQTLAIITGAFVVCWLPFFVMALLLSLCKSCEINAAVASLFLWLGYFNSTLNPIIYTIFNPEFRRAFQRLLFGKKYVASKCKRRSGNI